VVLMRKISSACGILVGKLEGREHLEDLGIVEK